MTRTDDLGKLILRLAVGFLILLHGIAKISGGVSGISAGLVAHGLPSVLAYGVYIGEIVAPALLIVGLYSRPAAWVIVINMLVAIYLVHMKNLGVLGKSGGWAIELEAMYLFGALTIALIGAGRYGLGGSRLN